MAAAARPFQSLREVAMLYALVALVVGIGMVVLGSSTLKQSVVGGLLVIFGALVVALAAVLGLLAAFDASA